MLTGFFYGINFYDSDKVLKFCYTIFIIMLINVAIDTQTANNQPLKVANGCIVGKFV